VIRLAVVCIVMAGLADLGLPELSAARGRPAHAGLSGVSAAREGPSRAGGAAVPWAHYLEAPASRTASPVRVISTSGDVTNPDALAHPGGGATTTLTYAAGGSAPAVVLDYGLEVGGYPQFDVTAATRLPTLHAAYSETQAQLSSTGDQSVTPAPFTSSEANRFDEFQVTGPGQITNRYIQGGERYELLTLTSPGSVRLSSVDVQVTGELSTPNTLRGYFYSSSDLLNRIWYAGIYTVNLNQQRPGTTGVMPGEVDNDPLLLDGAKRDRAVWVGDQAISDLAVYDALDPTYARDSIALIGAHPGSTASLLAYSTGEASQPGPMPGACAPFSPSGPGCVFWSASYSMLYVLDVYEYYLYTGDLAFVRSQWPLVERQMAWDAQQVDSGGLFSTTSADGSDWNVDVHSGDLTYVNGVYVMALNQAADLAQALGQADQATSYRNGAAAIKRAVNDQLWDPQLGAYDASTSQRGTVVQDANVFAILSGIAAPARARAVDRVLTRALASPWGALDTASPAPSGYTQIVSPYIGSFQLQADFDTGQVAAGMGLIKTEWGWMVGHDPQGVDWEKIPLGGAPQTMTSTAHAWSTGATSALTQYVLGVQPLAPGYARLLVAPHPAGLRWAQGRVPTPNGPVDVSWRAGRCRAFTLRVRLPRGPLALVGLPGRRARALGPGVHVLRSTGCQRRHR
jgi:hypothetical protein